MLFYTKCVGLFVQIHLLVSSGLVWSRLLASSCLSSLLLSSPLLAGFLHLFPICFADVSGSLLPTPAPTPAPITPSYVLSEGGCVSKLAEVSLQRECEIAAAELGLEDTTATRNALVSLTHSPIHSLSLTHSLTHSTHSITHISHSFYAPQSASGD